MILFPTTQAPSYPKPYIISPVLKLKLGRRRKQSISSLRCSAPNPNQQHKKSPQISSTETRLVTKLRTTLNSRKLLQSNQKVLVAVSGGQDSIALIYLLKQLQHEWKWELGVVHCDHQWSPASRPQASHVSQVASFLGLDFYQAVATGDVTGETAARTWRYNVLHRIASSHGYSAIVTAHTASDRVETLLHNLFRGTGLHGMLSLTWKRWLTTKPNSFGNVTEIDVNSFGLKTESEIDVNSFGSKTEAEIDVNPFGSKRLSEIDVNSFGSKTESEIDVNLFGSKTVAENGANSFVSKAVAEIDSKGEYESEARSIALVRPLLDVSRVELRKYSDMERLPIWPDQSNFSMDIRRNRIRHKLLPFLRKNFDQSVDKSLLRWAEILHGEDDFMDNFCMSILKQAESLHDDGRMKLDITDIRNIHVAIQRRIIKEFVEGFSERSLGFDHVENVRVTCLSKKCRNGFCISLPGNVVLQFLDNAFLLSKKQRR